MSDLGDLLTTTRDGVTPKEGDPVFFIKAKGRGDYKSHILEAENRGGFMVWVGASEGPIGWGYSTLKAAEEEVRRRRAHD